MAVKVGFIGNCQAQALQSLSLHLGADYRIIGFEPVWLYTAADEGPVMELAGACDIIFYQRISEDYGVRFLRTSAIKAAFPGKVISWPNLYFDGYFPTISYIYTPKGKLTGPLSDYHFPLIRQAWQTRRPAADVVAEIVGETSPLFSADPVAASLAQLRDREAGLDVTISDRIAEAFADRKLFYTPNHPVDEMLYELLARLTAAGGLKTPSIRGLDHYPYSLKGIDIPALPGFHAAYPSALPRRDVILGRVATTGPERIGETEAAGTYAWDEIVEVYYRVYDAYAAAGYG